MATDRSNDVRAFRDFLDEKLSTGAVNLTLDEALGLWEIETQRATEHDETVQALRDVLEDSHAGETGRRVRRFQAEASRPCDLPRRSRIPASSRVRTASPGEHPPSRDPLHGSRWLD